jgi:BAI1-associated protein 2
MFLISPFLQQVTFWPEEDIYTQPRNSASAEDLEERMSLSSQLRKTKSMDASCLDIRAIGDLAPTSPMSGGASSLLPLTRAKSEFNLTASNSSLVQGV